MARAHGGGDAIGAGAQRVVVVGAEGIVGEQRMALSGGVGECHDHNGAGALEERSRVAPQIGVALHVGHAGVAAGGNPSVVACRGLGGQRVGFGEAAGHGPGFDGECAQFFAAGVW